MTGKVILKRRSQGRYGSALAGGSGRCLVGTFGLLVIVFSILGPKPDAWGVSSDVVDARLRTRLAERIKPEAVAEGLGLSWPVRPTTASLATVHEEIRAKIAAEVELKWPEKSFSDFEAAAKAAFRIYKAGDEVSVTIRRGAGKSIVEGQVREIGPGTIRIGSRWIARGDLDSRDLAHFEPELAAKEIAREARKSNNQYLRERTAFESEARRRLVNELYSAAGYTWRDGDWVSAKKLFDDTLGQMREDEMAVLRPIIEDEVAAEAQDVRVAAAEVSAVPRVRVVGDQPALEGLGRPWSAQRATGVPDFEPGKDADTAWAPLAEDDGNEWLELRYAAAVGIAQIGIHEALNPGAVSRVTAFTLGAGETVLWEGQTPRPEAGTVLQLRVAGGVLTDRIRVYLDTRRVPGWNAIDAVELLSVDGTSQWAVSASCSSTFADDPLNLIATEEMDGVPAEGKPLISIVGYAVAVAVILLALLLGIRFRKKRAAARVAGGIPPPAPGARPGPQRRA